MEYWGALRAFLRPYFLDSFSRASRRRESCSLECGAQLGVQTHQGSGDAQPQCAGLTGHAATVNGGVHVVGLVGLGETQGLDQDHPVGRVREVVLEGPVVDGDGSGAVTNTNSGDRALPATGGLDERLRHSTFLGATIDYERALAAARSSSLGCWLWWGWVGPA